MDLGLPPAAAELFEAARIEAEIEFRKIKPSPRAGQTSSDLLHRHVAKLAICFSELVLSSAREDGWSLQSIRDRLEGGLDSIAREEMRQKLRPHMVICWDPQEVRRTGIIGRLEYPDHELAAKELGARLRQSAEWLRILGCLLYPYRSP